MEEIKWPPPEETSANVYVTELLERRWLSKKAFEIDLTRPASFEFKPGQGIRFIHETRVRDYSLISTPADSTLALCVRYLEEGIFTPILASAKIGTRFYFTGPYGYFTFRPSRRPAVFVATGTGIAPFLSMGRSGIKGVRLLHGVRAPQELYYESFFRTIARLYVPCLSEVAAESAGPPGTYCGKVTGYLERLLPPMPYDFYLCGRQEMIRDATLLVDERFQDSIVYSEIFY